MGPLMFSPIGMRKSSPAGSRKSSPMPTPGLDRTRAGQAGCISQTPKKSLSGCAGKSILAGGYADKKVPFFSAYTLRGNKIYVFKKLG